MQIIRFETLENKLLKLRDTLVLLDKDVAELYDIEPKKLRQQLKRNLEKFPRDYAYQISDEELELMVSQNVTPSKKQYDGTNPWVFTEKGLYMVNKLETKNYKQSTNLSHIKFEFNLGFAKVSRSLKKIKKSKEDK